MKTVQKELLGFNVEITGVVETLAEAVEACGGEEAVVNKVNAQEFAHGHYGKLRGMIVTVLAEATEVKQEDNETAAKYIARLEDELGEGALAQYEAAIFAKSQEMPIDYTSKPRGSGTGAAPAKKWLAGIDQLREEDRFDAFCEKYGIDQDSYDTEDELTAAAAHKLKEAINAAMAAALATV